MKKLQILLIAISVFYFTSCILMKNSYEKTHETIDFKYLESNGIFATSSNSVSFDYKPLGYVTATSISGYEVLSKKEMKPKYADSKTKPTVIVKYGKYKSCNITDAFDELNTALHNLGANGVINLKIEYISKTYGQNSTYEDRIIVSGMAIKK